MPAEKPERGKAPAFQWYPGDFRRDVAVQACSFGARSLWREMIDLMHDGEPYGHLTAGGVPITPEQLGRMIGVGVGQVRRWMGELEERNVFCRTENGTIYSRRMVRDHQTRVARGAFGKLGGSPKLGVEYNKPGFVYLMRRMPSGEVKIGASAQPSKRIYKIRQQFPDQTVDLLVSSAVDDMGAAEAALHQEFARFSRGGEWFAIPDSLLLPLVVRLKENPKEKQTPAVASASASATALEDEQNSVSTKPARGAASSELHIEASRLMGYVRRRLYLGGRPPAGRTEGQDASTIRRMLTAGISAGDIGRMIEAVATLRDDGQLQRIGRTSPVSMGLIYARPKGEKVWAKRPVANRALEYLARKEAATSLPPGEQPEQRTERNPEAIADLIAGAIPQLKEQDDAA